jgi:predicted DCC family thiol-disulfide oxidoreductase YuxK
LPAFPVTSGPRRPPLLLYDAHCSVCRRFVSLVIKADRRGTMRVGTLQGGRGASIRRAFPDIGAGNSAIWIFPGVDPVAQSDAILGVMTYLGGWWGALAVAGRVLPTGLRNLVYRLFARNRHYFAWIGMASLDAASTRALVNDDTWDEGAYARR